MNVCQKALKLKNLSPKQQRTILACAAQVLKEPQFRLQGAEYMWNQINSLTAGYWPLWVLGCDLRHVEYSLYIPSLKGYWGLSASIIFWLSCQTAAGSGLLEDFGLLETVIVSDKLALNPTNYLDSPIPLNSGICRKSGDYDPAPDALHLKNAAQFRDIG